MKEMPIILNTEMVKAIIEGRKTQMRSPMKPQPKGDFHHIANVFGQAIFTSGAVVKSPFGQPGDLIYVRETWRTAKNSETYEYKADGHGSLKHQKWKSSIYTPKDAARIWLEVKRVWVERVQDISEEDAMAEGVAFTKYLNANARYHFMELWNAIYPESWERNDWVWACEFEVLSTTGKPEER